MRKFFSLILILLFLNTIYIAEVYSFSSNNSKKICNCNHNSEKEIHKDDSAFKSESDCHTTKKNPSHRCVCKTSKSKKNSIQKVSQPLLIQEIFNFYPNIQIINSLTYLLEIILSGFDIKIIKPPQI